MTASDFRNDDEKAQDLSDAPPAEPTLVVAGADPAPHEAAPRSASVYLLALLAIVVAIAAFVLLSRRQPAEEPAAVAAPSQAPEAGAPAPVTLEIPEEPRLLGAPSSQPSPSATDPAHASPSPSPDKIFNNEMGALKDGIDAVREAAPDPAAATINELPPPPAHSGGNHSLQDAAKDAASIFSTTMPDQGAPPEETAPEPEASLPPDATRAADRLYADELSARVARLEAERKAGAAAALALARGDGGAPRAETLKASFPAARNKALTAIRREGAQGAGERVRASLASYVNLRRAGPTQGPDAVAVMSRAEAAVDAGDFALALAELDALPAEGSRAMAAWRDDARRRIEADRAKAAATEALIAIHLRPGAPG